MQIQNYLPLNLGNLRIRNLRNLRIPK